MTYEEALETKLRMCDICRNEAKPTKAACENCSDKVAIECIEKQIPKKPIEDTREKGWLVWNCPVCGKEVGRVLETLQHHCECGQAIDWGDEE